MKFWDRLVFSNLLMLLALASASAQSDSVATLRPVASAWTLGGGSAHLADTYLTPLHYDGWSTSIAYERFQAMRFDPERWVMRLNVTLDLASAHNPARNATMWDLQVQASWGMMRRWAAPWVPGLSLALGGSTSINAGALLLARNSNNPVSAKGAWTVNLTAQAIWNTSIGRLPITMRWLPELPLAGIFFSPDYGELYYEIYLGNHSGLVHFAWPGSRFALNNLLTADLRFGATALRLGYRGEILTSRVNHITTRRFTHQFVIGLAGEFISLSPRRPISERARTISAFY